MLTYVQGAFLLFSFFSNQTKPTNYIAYTEHAADTCVLITLGPTFCHLGKRLLEHICKLHFLFYFIFLRILINLFDRVSKRARAGRIAEGEEEAGP